MVDELFHRDLTTSTCVRFNKGHLGGISDRLWWLKLECLSI